MDTELDEEPLYWHPPMSYPKEPTDIICLYCSGEGRIYVPDYKYDLIEERCPECLGFGIVCLYPPDELA